VPPAGTFRAFSNLGTECRVSASFAVAGKFARNAVSVCSSHHSTQSNILDGLPTCSMLPSVIYRTTVTVLSWPIRNALPIACSSSAGFHRGSTMWTRSASVRVNLLTYQHTRFTLFGKVPRRRRRKFRFLYSPNCSHIDRHDENFDGFILTKLVKKALTIIGFNLPVHLQAWNSLVVQQFRQHVQ